MYRRLLSFGFILSLGLSLGVSPVLAQFSVPTYSLSLVSKNLLVGSSDVVTIGLAPTAGKQVTGVDVVLSYDPTIVKLTPVAFQSTGNLFTNNIIRIPSSTLAQFSSTDVQAGTYYSSTTSSAAPYAQFTIQGVKAGQTQIKFVCSPSVTTDTNIVENGTGNDIVNCSALPTLTVTVTAPTPVPTPVPTPTPTPVPPTPTPTPVPTVIATPTPTAGPIIPVCLTITRDAATPVLGQQVRFTCGQVANATAYHFRYRVVETNASGTLAPISTTSNISQPLTISTQGTYDVECQVCINSSCSPYTAW